MNPRAIANLQQYVDERLHPREEWVTTDVRLGIVRDTPDDQEEFADARYYVTLASLPSDVEGHEQIQLTEDRTLDPTKEEGDSTALRWVVATNLSEIVAAPLDLPSLDPQGFEDNATHRLGPGDPVLMVRFTSLGPKGFEHWVIVGAEEGGVLVRIDTNAFEGGDNGGKYRGFIQVGHTKKIDEDGANLDLPQPGEPIEGEAIKDGPDCLIVNLEEIHQPTHWLCGDANPNEGRYTFALGRIIGHEPDQTRRPIVAINGGTYRKANPYHIPGIGTQFDAWNRDNKPIEFTAGDGPVAFRVLCRNPDSPTSKADIRQVEFDAAGRLHFLDEPSGTFTVSASVSQGTDGVRIIIGDTTLDFGGFTVTTNNNTHTISGGGGIRSFSFSQESGVPVSVDDPIVHSTGIPIIARGTRIFYINGLDGTHNASATPPDTQEFKNGLDLDNQTITAIPGMPAEWDAEFAVEDGILVIKITAMPLDALGNPEPGQKWDIAGNVETTPPLVDTVP